MGRESLSAAWFEPVAEADLRVLFRSPPAEYSLLPFWAWNDDLDEARIQLQIDKMVDKGIRGAFLHARAGLESSRTPYFSEGWWNAVDTAVRYGAQKGFFAILYDEDKWPSGSAGGRVVAADRERFAKKGLKAHKWELAGPQRIALPGHQQLVALLAVKINPDRSIDMGSLLDLADRAGTEFDLPEGDWSILSFEVVRDAGVQIDYLSKEAVARFIDLTHEQYYRRYGRYFGNTIPGIFFDEIYANMADADLIWTDDFLAQFRSLKGYELKSRLPLLLYDGGYESAKVRCDYFDVATRLYIEAWFKQLATWCEDHGIWLIGHTVETIRDFQNQGDYFRTMAHVQIPATDNEDFRYTYPRRVRWFKAKQLSSLCHVYGRRRAAVEALGGGGWVIPLSEYKYGLSMLGVYGLNLFVPHLFHYSVASPVTMDDWPPCWFFRNPYWKYFDRLAEFARRVAYMGSQGRHVCDVCILYPITTLWAGIPIPRRQPYLPGGGERGDLLEIQYDAIQETLLSNLFDYDIVDPGSLIRSTVFGKKLRIADEEYTVLILPPLTTIERRTADKIREFFDAGGIVIAVDRLPTASSDRGEGDAYVIGALQDVFGFDPRSVAIGYLEVDSAREREYLCNTGAHGGMACFTKWPGRIPQILSGCLRQDVTVVCGDSDCLHFLHRRTANSEIYFLVNETKRRKELRVSFRDGGRPELWNPETGSIHPVKNYLLLDGGVDLSIVLDPWAAVYVVLSPVDEEPENLLIPQTDLYAAEVSTLDAGRVRLEAWRRGEAQEFSVEIETYQQGARRSVLRRFKTESQTEPILLDGEWRFIPAPRDLDDDWRSEVSACPLEIPVFKFRCEHERGGPHTSTWSRAEFDDSQWKTVRVEDPYSKSSGCKRYLSAWDSVWITHYSLAGHWGRMGGDVVYFRKELDVNREVDSGWACVTADRRYRLSINGREVGQGSDWRVPVTHQITPFLREGSNRIVVEVERCEGMLFQGRIRFKDGGDASIVSDAGWQASLEGELWSAAFPYAHPPLGPWGELPMGGRSVSFPLALWYRQQLPAGTRALRRPTVSGVYTVFVNGREVKAFPDREETDISELVTQGTNTLAVRVIVGQDSDGLLKPFPVVCGYSEGLLESWTEKGLSWYSGRAVYSREFDLPAPYVGADKKLILDLGDVRHCAEIWVNRDLVTCRPWPSYSADITPHVRPGPNTLSIVVANLLANQRYWEIYDDALTNPRSRFMHHGVVLREMHCLDSGLLGPVRLLPLQREERVLVIASEG